VASVSFIKLCAMGRGMVVDNKRERMLLMVILPLDLVIF